MRLAETAVGPPGAAPLFDAEIESQLQRAWEVRVRHHPMELDCCDPSRTGVVSVTGSWCALNCAHCGGRYLRGMTPPGELGDLMRRRPSSWLVSGGCDPSGRVPVAEHQDLLRRLRRCGPVNLHVGLIPAEEAAAVAPLVDAISFDLLADGRTIREVTGLTCGPETYFATYDLLRACARVKPHICIGIRGGGPSGEERALEFLARRGAEEVIFIVFIPTPGTRYQHRPPPDLKRVVEVLCAARTMLPRARLKLGCMRPRGRYRALLDLLAVRSGFNSIVRPTAAARRLASTLGLHLVEREGCCALW